ncbi:MAG: DNA polymerase III subunit delta [Bacteroidales bacterium]
MFFKDIPGQQKIKERLIRSVTDSRISHAQLFIGGQGSMKLPMAVAYARFITCTSRIIPPDNPDAADACGHCPSCLKFNNLAHPDLHFIFPVAQTSSVKKPSSDLFIQQWRELWKQKQGMFSLTDWYASIETENKQPIINVEDCNQVIKKLSYKSYESEYKVMIIWMIEKLFHSAAPKILKILEEPPEKTLILLIAQDQSLILNTILSRTQIIRFPRLRREDIINHLQSQGHSPEVAARAAAMADGNLLNALEMINSGEMALTFFDHFRQWLRFCFNPSATMQELVKHSEMLAELGRENQKRFLAYGLNLLQQAFVKGLKQTNHEDASEEGKFIANLAPYVHKGNIAGFESLFNDAIVHTERHAYAKVLFLDTSLKLVKLIRQPPLS